MERYKNLGGNSGILGFEIGADFIKVQFIKGAVYLYTYASAGSIHIERMKQLARNGRGLNSYIDTHVKYKYVRR